MPNAVDSELFVVCRLCMEDTGTYLIVPDVQKKIDFCFGIDVQPFDGMSQLICKSCEAVLCNFSEIKLRYIKQQNKLRELTIHKQIPSSSQQASGVIPKIKDIDKCSVTSTNQVGEVPSYVQSQWKREYFKKYVCYLCGAHCKSKISLKFHNLSVHSAFKGKHSKIFRTTCQVRLPRIDDKPNLTGSYKYVVYSNEKIIEENSPDYHVIYFKKQFYTNDNEQSSSHIVFTNNDSSDSCESDVTMKRKSRQKRTKSKRRRLESNSSHDTMLLDDKCEKETDCVKIQESIFLDDTDDDEKPSKDCKSANFDDNGLIKDSTITKIITGCENKYFKKMDLTSSNCSGVLLRRIILSVGRKTINRKGFNSSALLRFLEHRNLEIVWIPKPPFIGNESNYVKILTRTKNTVDVGDKDSGWIDYCCSEDKQNTPITEISAEEADAGTSTHTETAEKVKDQCSVGIDGLHDSAVLYSVVLNDPKKLLNANPVANPKQLPKKTDKCPVIVPKQTLSNNENTNVFISNSISHVADENENNFAMPIITSTTSLADNDMDNMQKPVECPRIKLKPLTELMSQESLSRLNNPIINVENVTIDLSSLQFPFPVLQQSNPTPLIPPTLQIQGKQPNIETIDKNRDYLILDSIDLPKRKTNSPFEYFKTILRIHDIVLLDTSMPLSADFNCLIRFKVLFKQESKKQPVILCISLHCFANVFCIKIRDRNDDDIDISKISANWQWEILNIFRGEVASKLLANAQKLSIDIAMNANKFISLFKSIKSVEIVKES